MEHFSALVAALDSAVKDVRDNRFVPPDVAHERIRTMYTWENVARRTEKVSCNKFVNKFDWSLCALFIPRSRETGHEKFPK